MLLATLVTGFARLCFARQGCVRAACAQPHGAKRTCTQPAASEASRTLAWRRSRHPNIKLVHSLAPRSGREPSLRQAKRAAPQPGGKAAIHTQKSHTTIIHKLKKHHLNCNNPSSPIKNNELSKTLALAILTRYRH